MATEKRLIDAIELANFFGFMRKMWSGSEIMNVIHEAETGMPWKWCMGIGTILEGISFLAERKLSDAAFVGAL